LTAIRTIAVALCAIAAASSLAGCATAPLSVEERLWFDKATGADITNAPPGLRFHEAAGYPQPGRRPY